MHSKILKIINLDITRSIMPKKCYEFVLLIYFICFAIVAKKTGYVAFCNVNFWLFTFWVLIIGVFFTSGIIYKYGHSPYVWLFLFTCGLFFILE